MRKRGGLVSLACVLAVILGGCAPTSVGATTVVVEKGGGLTYYLVGTLEKEYYDLAELSAMAEAEAAEFCGESGTEGSGPVKVERVERLREDEGKIAVVYRFDGSDGFSDFTGSKLFCGAVSEAVSEGYSLEGVLRGVKDGAVRTEGELLQDGKKMLIITEAKAVFYFPSGVSCLSEGLSLSDDGSVDTSRTEGTAYILLK